MSHPAESTHWYTADGKPMYQVEAKKGGMRNATLRDARVLNLYPSVTSIIRCAAAPGLERWKQTQVLHAALTLPKIEGESEAVYLDRIMQDSQEQGKKAAERGTAIHAALQGAFEGQTTEPEMLPYIEGVKKELATVFDPQEWTAEMSFSHELGFGGKTDLHSPEVVLDFKTKEFGKDTKLETWDEHAMQLAAYRQGLGFPKAMCAIVYVSVTVPGLAQVIHIEDETLSRGWTMFRSLLAYWCAKNNYQPKLGKG